MTRLIFSALLALNISVLSTGTSAASSALRLLSVDKSMRGISAFTFWDV
jgi:hypothetical protein